MDRLPQCERVKDKGYEILYMNDGVDEFALQAIKDGAESVDIYYNDMSSYLGTFYADGEMPRIFKK